MNVQINNQYEGGSIVGTNASYVLTGDFRKNPESGKVTSLNLGVNSVEDVYIGNVNAWIEGSELKYNLNNIALAHLIGVAGAVGELVQELEASIEE